MSWWRLFWRISKIFNTVDSSLWYLMKHFGVCVSRLRILNLYKKECGRNNLISLMYSRVAKITLFLLNILLKIHRDSCVFRIRNTWLGCLLGIYSMTSYLPFPSLIYFFNSFVEICYIKTAYIWCVHFYEFGHMQIFLSYKGNYSQLILLCAHMYVYEDRKICFNIKMHM